MLLAAIIFPGNQLPVPSQERLLVVTDDRTQRIRKHGNIALKQWRDQGRWPAEYDGFWEELQERHGQPAGTRQMIELLGLGKKHGYDRLQEAVKSALATGCCDVAAVRYLLTMSVEPRPQLEPMDLPVVTL